jgi:predicted porin
MNRAALLGGTAIAALLASFSAQAGSVGTGDSLAVSLEGEVRTNLAFTDQDDSAGRGRGYRFHTDEAELKIEARNVADNGILYGVEIVLNVNTDDTENADKVFAFIDDDNDKLGRLEMGDTDDAIDNMIVGAHDVMAGRAGFDGELADVIQMGDNWFRVHKSHTGKATKVNYFTPRIAGFQVGASITPDTGAKGATFSPDNDSDYENTFSIAANYVGEYDDLTVTVAVGYENGEGNNVGDAETFTVGANVEFGSFAVGAAYGTLGDTGITSANQALGQDAGEFWDVAAKYSMGPWAVSVGYYESEIGNVAGVGDTKHTVLSFDGEYEVAPGWTLAGSLNFADAENRNRTAGDDNDGTALLIYNIFVF